MSANIIEQADRIVGIDASSRYFEANVAEPEKHINLYRLGAYLKWLEECKVGDPHARPNAGHALEDIAKEIVALHAASKVKGDGLPDITSVAWAVEFEAGGQRSGDFVFLFQPPVESGNEAHAICGYLRRCLTKPVRRLLAEFEVTDQTPAAECPAIHIPDLQDQSSPYSTVCWLVPKAVQP